MAKLLGEAPRLTSLHSATTSPQPKKVGEVTRSVAGLLGEAPRLTSRGGVRESAVSGDFSGDYFLLLGVPPPDPRVTLKSICHPKDLPKINFKTGHP